MSILGEQWFILYMEMRNTDKEFWAITTFFNSEQYGNKYENYKEFRERSKKQGLKLITVECAFKDQLFELNHKDSDILIQVRSNSILWQKERLLNIGLKNLPENCDKFAWIDADIIFLNDNWVNETSQLLDVYKVVQPYEFAIRLDKSNKCKNVNNLPKGEGENVKYDGIAARNAKKIRDEFRGHTGFAWAARREIFEEIGFYDRFILGNGDKLISESIFNENTQYNHSDTPVTKRRVDWTRLLYSKVKGSVYYTDGIILHLWHGDFKNRNHQHRRDILKEFNFDENKDIVLNGDGCWEWSTKNKKLINFVSNYFAIRSEDGYKSKNFILEIKKIFIFIKNNRVTHISFIVRNTIRKYLLKIYLYLQKNYLKYNEKKDEIISIHLTKEEQELFLKTVKDSQEYFEYGSGGSTAYVYEKTQSKINSVDSSVKWINKIKRQIPENSRVQFKYIYVGKLIKWGKPANQHAKVFWPEYSKSIFKLANTPDVVFIDGRFRVACAIQTILFCLEKNIRPKVVLHDCVRQYYSEIYSVLDPVECVESSHAEEFGLQVFSLKQDYNRRELEKLFEKYKYDMR